MSTHTAGSQDKLKNRLMLFYVFRATERAPRPLRTS